MISKAGKQAADACADKAEQVTEFSTAKAQEQILKLLEKEGPQTGETLVRKCKEAGLVPHDDRAFGSAFGGLRWSGRIRKIRYGPRHRGPGTSGAIVWDLV